MKVLITCGPTWVKIDDVRVISNISSGQMGHLIASLFKTNGAAVTLIEGPVTHEMDRKGIKVLKFKFFDELRTLLLAECRKKYDVIIHAAAVADFKTENLIKGKINSAKKLKLNLVPTEKIINRIKKIAPESCLVGFKLEPTLNKTRAVKIAGKLFDEASCDLVLINSLKGGYKAYMIDADRNIQGVATEKKDIAQQLIRILK